MNSRLARPGAARQGNIKAEGKALPSQLLDEWRREKWRENKQMAALHRCSRVEPKAAANKDARSQTAPAFEPTFGALVTKGLVHPIAGATFLHARETNALDFKFPPDQGSQVCTPDKNIPARRLRLGLRKIQIHAALRRTPPTRTK